MSEQQPPAAPLPPEQVPGVEARQKYQEQLKVTDNSSFTLTRPAAQAVAVQPERAALSAPSSQSGKVQFALALIAAQQAVPSLPLDGYNAYHKYHYTRSETIIEAAKKALGECGLAFVPFEGTVDGHDKEGENRFEWNCKYVIRHVCGEDVLFVRHWPICIEKGRPLDKATASARTSCLAYFFCDLLLIPRRNPPEEAEAEARNDAPPQQKARPQKPAKKSPPPPPVNGADLEKRLRAFDAKLADAKRCKPTDLYGAVLALCRREQFPDLMADWNAEQCRLAMDVALRLAKEKWPAPAEVPVSQAS
jgi:hypothetical protein